MVSRKKWFVHGVATKVRHRKNGIWVTAKGRFGNDCISSRTSIDCWIPNYLVDNRRNYFKHFDVSGVLVFEDNDTYLLVEQIG